MAQTELGACIARIGSAGVPVHGQRRVLRQTLGVPVGPGQHVHRQRIALQRCALIGLGGAAERRRTGGIRDRRGQTQAIGQVHHGLHMALLGSLLEIPQSQLRPVAAGQRGQHPRSKLGLGQTRCSGSIPLRACLVQSGRILVAGAPSHDAQVVLRGQLLLCGGLGVPMHGQSLVNRCSLSQVVHQGQVELRRGVAAVREAAVVVQNAAEVGLEIAAVGMHQGVLLQRARMALVGGRAQQGARLQRGKRGLLGRCTVAHGRVFLRQQHAQCVLGAGVARLGCGLVVGGGFPDVNWRTLAQRVQNTQVVVRLGATEFSRCAQTLERAGNIPRKRVAVLADTAGHGVGRAIAGRCVDDAQIEPGIGVVFQRSRLKAQGRLRRIGWDTPTLGIHDAHGVQRLGVTGIGRLTQQVKGLGITLWRVGGLQQQQGPVATGQRVALFRRTAVPLRCEHRIGAHACTHGVHRAEVALGTGMAEVSGGLVMLACGSHIHRPRVPAVRQTTQHKVRLRQTQCRTALVSGHGLGEILRQVLPLCAEHSQVEDGLRMVLGGGCAVAVDGFFHVGLATLTGGVHDAQIELGAGQAAL